MKGQKFAIYYRVSTDKQDLDSQEVTINNWLAGLPDDKKPKEIVVYKDIGISGSTTKRPEYQKMLQHAFTGQIDTIVVYKLDRFSRNANTAIKTLLDLDESGVAFISVTQPVLNLGHDNPFRRTMLSAFAEIAELERGAIVSRVKSGLEAAKKKGIKLGTPIKINPDLEKSVFELRQQGQTMRQISDSVGVSLGTVHRITKQEGFDQGIK